MTKSILRSLSILNNYRGIRPTTTQCGASCHLVRQQEAKAEAKMMAAATSTSASGPLDQSKAMTPPAPTNSNWTELVNLCLNKERGQQHPPEGDNDVPTHRKQSKSSGLFYIFPPILIHEFMNSKSYSFAIHWIPTI